jgi:hypothetical protein
MGATMIEKNYGYICSECDVGVLLASFLPYWEDVVQPLVGGQ